MISLCAVVETLYAVVETLYAVVLKFYAVDRSTTYNDELTT